MTTNPFDRLGKKIGLRALAPSGRTDVQHEIHANARQADLRHHPDPDRASERAHLGLLGRLAQVPCLLELFSSVPGEDKILDCVGKLIAFRQELRREAIKTARASPAPPFRKPVLWLITAGRPTLGLAMLGAVPAEGWPSGVYLTPVPAAGGRRPSAGMPGGLRVGFVVASELPRERGTILVRLMAGGATLAAAVADLTALPAGAFERLVASADVLELRAMLAQKSKRTREEEEFIVSTEDAFEQFAEEARREGRRQGEARALLAALRARGIPVPDAARERILAEKDPERLERWVERAVVASSLADVLDEPS
jgi:hypothetical protein